MGYILKRLLPGCLLIGLAMAVLLVSDLQHRSSSTQDSLPRVAVLQFASRPVLDDTVKGAVEGLAAQGFVDGKALQFEVLPQSPAGKAIAYALNLRVQLRAYVDHGYVGIDNNPVERVLRPVVVGRKNWLFAGSETGGQTMAVFYSLIQSAVRHGLNAAESLEDIMRRLPSHSAHRIRELLPDQ